MSQHQQDHRALSLSKSPLDRLLGVVTQVKPGESGTALLMALNVSLLLSAYYVIKPVREALILSTGGAEVKSYASVGQAALLTIMIPAYGFLVGKVRRQVLLPTVTAFFQGCLGLFYIAALMKMPFLGVAFYLFVGVFNLMVVAQFWSFASDIYSQEQGERLFPVVAFGASIGAVIGSWFSSILVRQIGIEEMLLVSAGILGCTIVTTKWVEQRVRAAIAPSYAAESRKREAPKTQVYKGSEVAARANVDEPRRAGAFELVFKSRYLLLIALLMFLANLVNTTGEYILGSVVEEAAKTAVSEGRSGGLNVGEMIGAFYGDFFFWVNVAGVILQLLLVSRVIRWIGVRGALMVLPIIALSSYLLLAIIPILGVVRWAKTAENATDYSLNNTVRNALFLPLSRDEKYKAKQVIDTFFVRGGDVASAGIVGLGLNFFGWSEGNFAWFNAGVMVVSITVAYAIGREYVSRRKKNESLSKDRE